MEIENLENNEYGVKIHSSYEEIIENFDEEIKNFIQVCPKEMINKLKNPISLKPAIKEVS